MDAAEAIARAKAIAARLAGSGAAAASSAPQAPVPAPGPTDVNSMLDAAFAGGGGMAGSTALSAYGPASTTSTGQKRGVEEALASLIPGLGTASEAKRPRTGVECTKKIVIPQEQNPGYNYVGLLIGPGGSKQRELVAASGGDVKISIRGKGSKGQEPVAPGMPEEPLHVLLEGSTACVSKAESLVRELLEDPEAADKEKARQLSIVGGNTDGYTPKPVAQLLGLGTGSTPASAYGPQPGEDSVEEKIGVPNGIVGLIIGRGGESITSMQRRTGCRVQIQKEHEMAPGTTQRVITLTATTAEAIAQCRAIIESMVKERIQATGSNVTAAAVMSTGGIGGSSAMAQMAQLQQALSEGQAHVTVQVPDADVGLVIGKGGAQIRNIQEKSGANVQIPQMADAGNPTVRTVNITHPNAEGANFAKQMIEEVLASKAAANGGNQETTIMVNCPDKDVGMIIGRGGCVIKQMQSTTRCRIQIPPTAPPGSMYRVISVIGNAAGCQQVKQMIETIVAEQSSQSVMSGVGFAAANPYGQQQAAYGQQAYGQAAYGQSYYGQQQTADATGQKDYSAEWAAYYAAMGQTGAAAVTAAAPAAAATATDTTTAPAPSGDTPAYDAYYEVFWQYASYYGEEAARKHYGAWSPPEGTPNPNLANGSASAPVAAAPSPADAQTSVEATSQEVRDTSVRKVSNLPAWMNKS